MDDRELLERAARAAGIKLEINKKDYAVETLGYLSVVFVGGGLQFTPWNPLTDDGDALRLAVKLGMNVWSDPAAVCMADVLKHCLPRASEPSKPDPYAATRRAIVRVAASLAEGEAK